MMDSCDGSAARRALSHIDRLPAPPATRTPHRADSPGSRQAPGRRDRSPRLSATVAAALFTGASLQQLATARPGDYHDAAATLALHDRARYTDGCASHQVPPWARVFLKAAMCFARLTPGQDHHLLADARDRAHLLCMAEEVRLRPPQPPAGQRTRPIGRVEWDWHERKEAQRYAALLPTQRQASSRRGPRP
ncbi:hypothetical protein T261_0087 [Streptomyces lydicus]|nr:hypothetical protein T261_0087 [Streptomyces lydicus]